MRSFLNQGLVHTRVWRRKLKCPFPRFSPSFCSFEGSRAISKPAPNPGTRQTPFETLSDKMHIFSAIENFGFGGVFWKRVFAEKSIFW